MIEQHVAWNDDIGEWQLRCVAYTGNNMRKQTPQPDKEKDKVILPSELGVLGLNLCPVTYFHRFVDNPYSAEQINMHR